MLQIYYGDGKGKTTAAFGLALRAAGRGRRVVIAQFLKSEDSGERRSMESVPHVLLLPLPEHLNFVWNMDVERAEDEEHAGRLLDDTALLAVKNSVLILDEVLGTIETDILPASEIDDFLAKLPENICQRFFPESIKVVIIPGIDSHFHAQGGTWNNIYA